MGRDLVSEDDAKHLSPDTVEDYFRSGIAAAFMLSTQVGARLEIDPHHQELRLIVPAIGGAPEVTSFERIRVDRLAGAGDSFVLTVDATGMHYEAYVLLESIVDQLRSGASFRHAVSESVQGLKGILASRRRMTEEKEAGLIGELIVLEHILDSHDEDQALQAWLGPLSEEHDFGFTGFDAEVKTTRSEGRSHVIGSETQLQPAPGRPLYLISVQITAAGNAAEGFTLPERIDAVRDYLEKGRRTFDKALGDLGWADADADLYRGRFQVRSAPRAYLVNDEFPAITNNKLEHAIPQRPLVSAISYRVDVSHLPFASAPAPLNDFCEEPE